MEHDAAFYFKRSNKRFAAGDAQGGYDDLDQAIRLAPNNTEYLWRRVMFRFQAEEHQLAAEDFTRIIELITDLKEIEDARRKRLVYYAHFRLHEEAIADLDWLIAHGLGDGDTYASRGYHRREAGDFGGAIEDYTSAHELLPQVNGILLQRSIAYYMAAQYEESVQDLTRIIESNPQQPNHLKLLYHNRGKALYRWGKHQEALDDFNQVARIVGREPYPDSTWYMQTLHLEE